MESDRGDAGTGGEVQVPSFPNRPIFDEALGPAIENNNCSTKGYAVSGREV
jgi:hypothetical protein